MPASTAEIIKRNFLAAHPDATRVCLREHKYKITLLVRAVSETPGMVTVTRTQQVPTTWVFYVAPDALDVFSQLRQRYKRH